jgi:hypothetical protein
MKVGLFDLGKLPNFALMKISAYHKSFGHRVALNEPGDLNYVSCVFTKNRPLAEFLLHAYPNVAVGGPGWDLSAGLPPEIEKCRPDYSLYGIEYGLGRLTKGCPGDCPFCVVPAAEGNISVSVATLSHLVNPLGDLVVLLDSNILACPDWPEHFRDIQRAGVWVDFTQGLDIRYVNDFAARELKKLKIASLAAWLKARRTKKKLKKSNGLIHFAFDKMASEPQVRAGIETLKRAGIRPDRLVFYMLVGYDTTWEEDLYRFEVLRSLGVHPFVMLYEGASGKLRHFARWVNRRLYKVCRWEEYRRYRDGQVSLVF